MGDFQSFLLVRLVLEVRDGIVTLTLLLGTLGEVEVHSNEMYDTDIITSVFDDDLAQPVTSGVIEENT